MKKLQMHGMIAFALSTMAVAACTEPEVRAPFAVNLLRGGGQQGEVGTPLPMEIAVEVVDASGRRIPRATVTFEVMPTASPDFTTGSVEPMTVETDFAGIARTRWTLGTAAGEQTLRAWAGTASGPTTPNVELSATAQAGPIATLAAESGQIVAITVGDVTRVRVVGRDRHGNLTATPNVTWQVSDPSVASISTTEPPSDGAATVVANARGTVALDARDAASHTVRFDVRTYVGPGRDLAYELNGNIYLLSADGATTTDLGAGHDPTWSPDGRQIAFATGNQDFGVSTIYVMNADGSGRRALMNPDTLPRARFPSWSPTGTKIAFVIPYQDPNLQPLGPQPGAIFTMNADGSGTTRVWSTRALCGVRCEGIRYPSWSPDGTRFVYSIWYNRSTGSPGDVFVVNADGSGDRALESPATQETAAAWSPDGARLVFASSTVCCAPSVVSPPGLYVANADGTGRVGLTIASSTGYSDLAPTWAPDGRIAFVRWRSGADPAFSPLGALFVVNADGTELRRVARFPTSRPLRVAWRPGS
jgi:Tol biopolymer transport system component